MNLGTLTIINSTISGNTTGNGGWSEFRGGHGGFGGGIANGLWSDGGTLTIINSTISGNTTGWGGRFNYPLTVNDGGGDGGYGGGIANDSYDNRSTLTIINSTISNNTTGNGGGSPFDGDGGTGYGGDGGRGGGILNTSNLNIFNSTLSLNTTGKGGNTSNPGEIGEGGGINNYDYNGIVGIPILFLSNSIIAGNSAGSLGNDIRHYEEGIVNTSGINLLSSLDHSGLSAGPGLIVADPHLAPLGHYGGHTQTMPPLPGSPALDSALGFPGPTDQRGVPRGDWIWENDFLQENLNGAAVRIGLGNNPDTGTINSGSFLLTPEDQEQVTSLILPAPTAPFSTFAASFDLSYSDATESEFNGPANGMSFSFGPPAPNGSYPAESGVPGAHVISFDFSNLGNVARLRYLRPNGTEAAATDFPRLEDSNSFQTINVTLDTSGRLQVIYKGNLVIDQENISYTYADGDTFTFAGRTSSEVSEQRIDNIGIVTNPIGGLPDIGAVEFQGDTDLFLYWDKDFDGDGNTYGVEQALGTDLFASDASNSRNLTLSNSANPTLRFGRNENALPGTIWVLSRSTDLSPGSFQEIYRFDGATSTPPIPNADLDFTVDSFISVTDQNPPPNKSFYQIQALPPGS